MVDLLKAFGRGILYILCFPFFLVALAIFAVIGLLAFIFQLIKSIFYFFTGQKFFPELPEDKELRLMKEAEEAKNNPQPQPQPKDNKDEENKGEEDDEDFDEDYDMGEDGGDPKTKKMKNALVRFRKKYKEVIKEEKKAQKEKEREEKEREENEEKELADDNEEYFSSR